MNQHPSPFKFLDAYQKEDREIFFGRDDEVQELYNALSGVKQLLLYGPSGSGKTSVIECGLRNQYSDADWFAITIRRGTDLNSSFYTLINNALKKKIAINPVTKLPEDVQFNFGLAVEHLYAQRFRPIYLLFDQFEELLILGTKEEKEKFFVCLNQLIQYKVPCKVIMIMREDFIGYLSEFEYLCPSLFQYRFRLEKMGRKNVQNVIRRIFNAPLYRKSFDVTKADELCSAILLKLPDKNLEIELAHVQVFLGELWDRAVSRREGSNKPELMPELIKDTDDLQSVLGGFLKKQFEELEPVYGERVPLEVLANMITNRNTKLQIGEQELHDNLLLDEVELKVPLINLLKELEARRIIRTIKVGDQTQYEISHDILAQLVGESRTEEMKLREKAQEIYALYDKRTETLGQNEINNLLLYEQYRTFPDALKELIKKSEDEINAYKNEKERQQRRQLKRTRIFAGVISGLAIGALVLAVYALDAQKSARENEKIAKENLAKFLFEQTAKDILRFKELEARANTILDAGGRPLAILDTMKSIYKVYDFDTMPKMKWIKLKIDSIKAISDSFYYQSLSIRKPQRMQP